MNTTRVMAALVVCAAMAGAEEPRWAFKKGDVRTYEAATVFDWSCAIPGARKGFPKQLNSRQEETVTLRLEVTDVKKDGSAELKGTFTAVKIEATFAAGKATWDSAKDKVSPFLGFKRYEALKSVVFTATVSPSGEILDAKNAQSPEAARTKSTEDDAKEAAPLATHRPTSPRAWLELIFRPVPPAKKGERRSIRFITDENCALSFSRNERVGARACAKIAIETPDRKPAIKPEEVSAEVSTDPNDIAWEATRMAPKTAEAWFASGEGVLVKLEAESNASVSYDNNQVSARMTWKIVLK